MRYLLQRPAGEGIIKFYKQQAANAAAKPATPTAAQPTKYRFVSDRPEASAASSISQAALIAAQRGL